MTQYLIIWWHIQDPFYTVMENAEAARAAAMVRNAVVVELGDASRVKGAWDWYRRDEKGEPMPIALRESVAPFPPFPLRGRGPA